MLVVTTVVSSIVSHQNLLSRLISAHHDQLSCHQALVALGSIFTMPRDLSLSQDYTTLNKQYCVRHTDRPVTNVESGVNSLHLPGPHRC